MSVQEPLLRTGAKEPVVEGRRWVVLLLFCFIEFNQGIVWITYSSSAPEAKELYGISDSTINLLLNWGPICYLPFVLIVMHMLTSGIGGKSVYLTILLGAVLCAAGAVVRMVPSWFDFEKQSSGILLVHIGQILNGCAGPSMAGACTAFAACWFAPEERTLATAIAYGICALGPGMAFAFAQFVRTTDQLETLMLIEMITSIASLVLWLCVPAKPAQAPSASQRLTLSGGASQDEEESVGACISTSLGACRNVSFDLLMLSGGIVFGVFQCWCASLPNVIAICPSESSGTGSAAEELGDDRDSGCMSEMLTQWLGFGGNIGSWVGTLVVGRFADTYFERRFKRLLLLIFGLSLILFALYTVSLPIGPHPPLLPSTGCAPR